jgi:aminoglycoside 3-N-acetyltransferase
MTSRYGDRIIFADDVREYRYGDILESLRQAGISRGETIFVHSDLTTFGRIIDVRDRTEFVQCFIDALNECIGPEGTQIVPTFSYSFCKNELFDVTDTPSTVGILTEQFRKLAGVYRSQDAIFSVAALGPESGYFTEVGNNCFGENSVFEKLFQRNARLVFLGKRFDITFMHFAEQCLGVSYRFLKRFPGQSRIGGELRDAEYFYNVRDLSRNVLYDLEKIASYLKQAAVLREAPLGHSRVRTVSARDAFNVLTTGLQRDPNLLLKEPVC